MKVSLTHLRGLELKQLDVEDLLELQTEKPLFTTFTFRTCMKGSQKPHLFLFDNTASNFQDI